MHKNTNKCLTHFHSMLLKYKAMEDMAKLVFLHQLSLLAVTMVEELSLWLDLQWFFVELKQLK